MRFLAPTCAFIAFTIAAPALAEDLQFDLVNQSSSDLMELYASPVGTDSWGEDILGADILASGETGLVTIADGAAVCEYDLRFVAADGSALEGTADLCAMSVFTLTD